ncbi:AhpC/TSA antioxidant enzyme-domain-containing protein [Sparassis latifolia]|uniref:Thioredoxin-like protein n=1 Tax=Sparassis crispa TaxID=139825 RepID=A0A401G4W6_9APHY|nr:hypothetical protein SCP_0100770 [Sparassis crispa]GBE77205.1 hypothetical protein SCP_0100770 [Sparassis crispa]
MDATRPSLPSLPDRQTLKKATTLPVYDAEGNKLNFKNIFREQKTILIFIRHFFCGSCQQYVSQLASVRKEALEWAGARIVLIGCGDWRLIANYCVTTGFEGDVYADPARTLYHIFDLIQSLERTPSRQTKRSYITKGFLQNALKSIWDGPIKNPTRIGKQGNISQLGGDFIFGPQGEKCLFASRMHHTEDHVEVADLMREAGVAYP